ncbi:MAG TPA: ATP-binding protein [Pseudomonadales bacterium]|nr:ATP-binding protein [Pseudomonadales bacterium]
MLSAGILLILVVLFFAAWFGLSALIDVNTSWRKFTKKPIAYHISLGIIGSAWTFYTITGLVQNYGISAFSYYIGISAVFLSAPLLLLPLLQLCKRYQLTSLADLMSFRFRSPTAGTTTTLLLTLSILPFYTLQLETLAEACNQLLGDLNAERPYWLVTLFIIFTAGSALQLATRHNATSQRHQNLIALIAFSTVLKVVALIALGAFAIWGVFDGLDGMEQWLYDHPDTLNQFYNPSVTPSYQILILIFFASIIGMPHLFHMVFAGATTSGRRFENARWAVPLLLLVMSLPVLPTLWASQHLGFDGQGFASVALARAGNASWLSALTFLGGLAAAAGIIVALNLALSTMLVNHVVLRISPLNPSQNIYQKLNVIRRATIVGISCLGFLLYIVMQDADKLQGFALMSFTASLQFMPGCIALLYWRGANRDGFLTGLFAGFTVWLMFVFFPEGIISGLDTSELWFTLRFDVSANIWAISAAMSLMANVIGLILISWLSDMRREERKVALACVLNNQTQADQHLVDSHSAHDIAQRLAPTLGDVPARNEVRRALKQINLNWGVLNASQVSELISALEVNLTQLLGPVIAEQTLRNALPYSDDLEGDIVYLENQLEAVHTQLQGVAGELRTMRANYQSMLLELPIGALTYDTNRSITSWNRAIAEITGIDQKHALKQPLASLASPWGDLLSDFAQGHLRHSYKRLVGSEHEGRWVNLHKAAVERHTVSNLQEQFLLIEDISETQTLEQELIHSERLASIGRLAAGVAHEIGNPVTGIACLAQNLNDDIKEGNAGQTAKDILTQTDRINTIVRSLMNFAHGDTYAGGVDDHACSDLGYCCREATKLLALDKEKQHVSFVLHIEDNTVVAIDEQRLIQLLINLLSNARDASTEGQTITISGKRVGDAVNIDVVDQGCGIPADHQEKIFEPFFTTKDTGSGTGLGLSLVYAIIEQHSGNIAVQSPVTTDGRGTRFVITLPVGQLR